MNFVIAYYIYILQSADKLRAKNCGYNIMNNYNYNFVILKM